MKFIVVASISENSTKLGRLTGLKEVVSQELETVDYHFIINLPNVRVYCDCCRKNITLTTFIMTEDSEYCVPCFAKFQQFPESYHIYERISFCLTDDNWMSLDQVLLLTGFQKWGFGNWGQIKDYMGYNGANFNKEQLIQHYDKYYLGNSDMLPIISEELLNSSREDKHIREIRKVQYQEKINGPKKQTSIKSEESIPPAKTPLDIKCIENKKESNILGYNPKRKSFLYELEYDDKAEGLLSDLQFRDDDSPQEIQLKFQIIQNFNKRQTERIKRYQFTIEHHILDIDYRFKQEISASKYQRDAFNSFKKFTRFQTHDENQKTRGLIAQNNYLKSMIQGLRKCRKKLDKSGKIDSTLEELKKKDPSLQKLGEPRKMFKIEISPSKFPDEKQLLEKIQNIIQSQRKKQSNENIPKLQITYRSPQFLALMQRQK